MLFANRKLNELASDWLAALPILTTTYHYRLHHLAHHQFVNDPERDPDISQLHESDHWLDFPITHVEVLWALLKQLWLPNLFRYTITRASYGSLGARDAQPLRRSRAPGHDPPVARRHPVRRRRAARDHPAHRHGLRDWRWRSSCR